MKRLLTTMAVSAVALSSIGAVHTAGAEEAQLKAASFLPGRVVFAKYFYDWVAEVNKQCAGKIKISVVGPAAISSLEQWNALKSGVVDMHYGPAGYMRGAMPAGDVITVAQNGPPEQRRNGARDLLVAKFKEQMNAVYLTHIFDGVKFYVYTTKPAKDGRFDGFRLRAVPLYYSFFRSLGATPVRMGAPQVYTALERRTVDGFGWPLYGVNDFGWHKFVKYRYGPGFFNTAVPIIVNLDRYNKLDPAQQKCLQDMALWLDKKWPEWRAAEDARQAERQKAAGIKYVELGAKFSQAAEDLYWADLAKGDPDFVKKIRPLLTK